MRLFAFCLVFFALPAFCLEVPYLSGPVMDEAGILSSSQKTQIEEVLTRLRSTSGVEMVVFIPSSLQGLEVEQFAIEVAHNHWKLGKKKEDKGLLLVIAPKERRMRLEVGYGLEGEITDARSKQILDDTIVPHFKQRQFAEGILAGIYRVADQLQISLEGSRPEPIARAKSRIPWEDFIFFLFPFFFLFVFPLILRLTGLSRRRRGYSMWGGWGTGGGGSGWSSRSSGGGGSWGGGGGGFGGGGASSSW